MKLQRVLSTVMVFLLLLTPLTALAETSTQPQTPIVQEPENTLPSQWQDIGRLTIELIDARTQYTFDTAISKQLEPFIIDKIKSEITPIDTRLTAASEQSKSDIGALSQRLNDEKGTLSALINENQAALTALSKRVDDANKAELAALTTQISDLQSKVQTLSAQSAEKDEKLAKLNSTVSGLNTRFLISMVGSVAAITAAILIK